MSKHLTQRFIHTPQPVVPNTWRQDGGDGSCADQKSVPMEHCVICGAKTVVPVTQHVEFRSCWVDGIGQYCFRCYRS